MQLLSTLHSFYIHYLLLLTSVMNLQYGSYVQRCMFASGRDCALCCEGTWNKKGYFSPLCKQLAASHGCSINGPLIANNHFYLIKFRISSYPWSKQLFVKCSGNTALLFEVVDDQCLQEAVLTWPLKYITVGTHIWKNHSNQSTVREDLL